MLSWGLKGFIMALIPTLSLRIKEMLLPDYYKFENN